MGNYIVPQGGKGSRWVETEKQLRELIFFFRQKVGLSAGGGQRMRVKVRGRLGLKTVNLEQDQPLKWNNLPSSSQCQRRGSGRVRRIHGWGFIG